MRLFLKYSIKVKFLYGEPDRKSKESTGEFCKMLIVRELAKFKGFFNQLTSCFCMFGKFVSI